MPETWLTVEEHISEGYRSATYRVRDGRFVLTAGEGDPDVVVRVWAGPNAWVRIGVRTVDDALVPLDPLPDERTQWDDEGGMTDLTTPTPSPVPEVGTDAGGGAGATTGEGAAR